jgi:CelD/BcsL family acetyltransferase involved in cellulose biosynthesis
MQARLLGNADELEAMAPAWWSLWRRCPNSTPFQSPGWLLPWWQSFAPGELMTVAVTGAGRLLGLAPLYLENGAAGPRVLPLGIGLSDYVDILIEPGFELAVGEALTSLLGAQRAWARIEFDDVPPGGSALALGAPQGSALRDECSNTCPVLHLATAPHGHGPKLPRRKCEHLVLARNRASRRGAVQFISMQELSPETLFSALVELHRARWQARHQPGVLADPRVLAFHGAVIARLGSEGAVRLYGVRIAEKLAAVYYGFADRGRAYVYLTGFDPAFSFESAGTLLLGHVINESWRMGAREFHFLRGAEAYKYSWGAVDRFNRRRTFERAPARVHA